MINIKIPIMSGDKTITRPIVVGIANDIKNIFSLNKDMETAVGNFINHYSDRDARLGVNPSKFMPKLSDHDDLKIDYEETIDEDAIITTDINDPRSMPIIVDNELDLVVKPIYVKSSISITVKYFTKSKSKAQTILNNLKIKSAENSEMMLHDLDYFYYISKGVGRLLIDVLDRKNNIVVKEEDKMSLEDYLASISGKSLNAANSYVGLDNKIDLIVKERQTQVTGFFNMDLINEKKEHDEDKNGFTTTFTYNINYNKPIYLYIKYPIIVYNKLLPKGYVQRITLSKDKIDIDSYLAGHSDAYKLIKTEYLINKWYRNWHYVSIPYYDLHVLPKAPPYYIRMVVVLLTINKEDKKNLFNLRDIPGYTFHEDVLDYIKSYSNDVFRKPYSNVFNFTLYENTAIIDPSQLRIDDDLNIFSVKDLDIKKTYRMAISVLVDWNLLNTKDRIKAMHNTTIGKRTIKFLKDDRSNVKLGDDSIITIPEPTLDNYVSGIYTTHIEAWLKEDIYVNENEEITMFDTEETDDE